VITHQQSVELWQQPQSGSSTCRPKSLRESR
jgi:hypothetical protein